MGKITKETPHRRRLEKPSLLSVQKHNEDVDIIGIVHEHITDNYREEKCKCGDKNESTSYGTASIYKQLQKVKEQGGEATYKLIYQFIIYLENKYVLNTDTKKNCTNKPLILIVDEQKIVDDRFNAILLKEEMHIFTKAYSYFRDL